MTLEKAAERFDMSPAQLSRIENAISPYTQDFLELAAHTYQTDVVSLLTRDPNSDPDLWSIWQNADERERRTIMRIVKATQDDSS
jgi:transcriptional regulator with XRE-family HTH domain